MSRSIRSIRFFWSVAFLAVASLAFSQQTPPRDAAAKPVQVRTGTASIAGTITDSVSGEPVRRVTVVASEQAAGIGGRLTVTGDDGRFSFRNMPAGRYLVTATKAAYLPTANGVDKPMRPGATPTGSAIALTEGQSVPNLVLRMTRGSVVTGVVRGPDGQPVRGASVSLAYFMRAPLTGDRTMAYAPSASATTDARGMYRMFGVAPGEYVASTRASEVSFGVVFNDLELTTDADTQRINEYVAARAAGRTPPAPVAAPSTASTPAPRRPTYGYATVFHPGTTSLANAMPLTLGPGEERGGIDFQVQLIPQSRVSGVVTGSDGRPASGITVRLSTPSPYAAGPFLAWLTATTDAKGQYVVRAVAAGDYVVEVRPIGAPGREGAPPAANAWARSSISVAPNEDARLDIALQPGRTVSGQIALDPASTSGPAPGAPPDMTRVRVALMNRDGLQSLGTVAADGRFTIMGVPPDAYRLMVSVPAPPGPPSLPGVPAPGAPVAPWFATSGAIGGRDALDAMVDVTDDVTNASVVLTTRVAEVSGAILDGAGRPAPEFFIVIFPADRALWTWQSRRIQQMRPASDGKFAFRNLPPGEYLIGAVTDVEQYQWFEPAFLSELLGVSVKLSLADGEKKTQDIRLR